MYRVGLRMWLLGRQERVASEAERDREKLSLRGGGKAGLSRRGRTNSMGEPELFITDTP